MFDQRILVVPETGEAESLRVVILPGSQPGAVEVPLERRYCPARSRARSRSRWSVRSSGRSSTARAYSSTASSKFSDISAVRARSLAVVAQPAARTRQSPAAINPAAADGVRRRARKPSPGGSASRPTNPAGSRRLPAGGGAVPRPGLLAERTEGGGVDDIGIWHPVPVPNRLILSRANPDVAAGLTPRATPRSGIPRGTGLSAVSVGDKGLRKQEQIQG